jgi:hypothetical protein
MGSQKEKKIFSETGKSNGKEAFSSSPNEPCCQKETVCSDEGTVGGTQEAGKSCVIGEPGSADYFQTDVIAVAALSYAPTHNWGTARKGLGSSDYSKLMTRALKHEYLAATLQDYEVWAAARVWR